jgi:hypothetical protein
VRNQKSGTEKVALHNNFALHRCHYLARFHPCLASATVGGSPAVPWAALLAGPLPNVALYLRHLRCKKGATSRERNKPTHELTGSSNFGKRRKAIRFPARSGRRSRADPIWQRDRSYKPDFALRQICSGI